ncbi:hypothetical protein QQS21_000445 [Conoideocrella luteorostrata]|uniref:Myb/SANT-like domain-containing protein n=1 Tax=Conoideocrella luteorostrata TaxID=1105319 RepID=A0AAJ0CYY6_9HYPO|nr:hypothetical protein QQS21_000445 [Conoideocrella luteorostrata]
MSNPCYYQWSDEETLYLVELLLATKEQRDNGFQRTSLSDLFRIFVPLFTSKFPTSAWNAKRISNRYNYLKNYWWIFQDAKKHPGTTYDADTGLLRMSRQTALEIEHRYRHSPNLGAVKSIIRRSLWRNDKITISDWDKIFPDNPSTCSNSTAAHGCGGSTGNFERQQDDDVQTTAIVAEDTTSIKTEPGKDSLLLNVPDAGTQPVRQFTTYMSDYETSASSDFEEPKASSSAKMVVRGRPTGPQQHSRPRGVLKKRAPLYQATDIAAAVAAALAANREVHHIVTTRVPGAADLENAVKDCQEFIPEHGMAFAMNTIAWLIRDPANPVVWNALATKEAKRLWVECDFGANTSAIRGLR